MRRSNSPGVCCGSRSPCTTTRSSTVTASATRKWQDSERQARSFDLVVGGGKIGQRHRNGDGFLAEVLKRNLQLFASSQRGQLLRCDRAAGVAAPRFAGLDRQVDRLAVIDLEFGAIGQIKSERQLHQGDR